jgi:hypothetical protein
VEIEMNKDGWLYTLSKAYLIGVGLVGGWFVLSYMPNIWQLLIGFTLGVVGWVNLRDAFRLARRDTGREKAESNNKKR